MLIKKLLFVFVSLFLISSGVESTKLNKIHYLVKENNKILKGKFEGEVSNKFEIKFNNLLAVIPEWGPNWKISFDLFIRNFDNDGGEYGSILLFTNQSRTSEDPNSFDNAVGCRIPALYTRNGTNAGGCFDNSTECDYRGIHYSTNLDNLGDNDGKGIGNAYINSPPGNITSGIWYSFEIVQKFAAFKWINTIKVTDENGNVVWNVTQDVITPNVYYNVAVYASGNFEFAQFLTSSDSVIKNFQYSSGTSSFANPNFNANP